MRFNFRKLLGLITEKFCTQSCFAEKIGMSERTLSLKLNNKRMFRQDEIAKMVSVLGIAPEDIGLYFFTLEVR